MRRAAAQRATISRARGLQLQPGDPGHLQCGGGGAGLQEIRAQARDCGHAGNRLARSQDGDRLGQRERAGDRRGAADRHLNRLAGAGAGPPATGGSAEPGAQSLHDVEAGAERDAGGRPALQPHGRPERIFADLDRRRSGARQQLSAGRNSDHRRRQSRDHHSDARSGGAGRRSSPTPTMRRWRAPAAACSTRT